VSEERALTEAVRTALRTGPFAMRQLAAECQLSYDVLRSWRSGRRRPNDASAALLAGGLRRRAERLVALAATIETELNERPPG
jgi:hypothetical protein